MPQVTLDAHVCSFLLSPLAFVNKWDSILKLRCWSATPPRSTGQSPNVKEARLKALQINVSTSKQLHNQLPFCSRCLRAETSASSLQSHKQPCTLSARHHACWRTLKQIRDHLTSSCIATSSSYGINGRTLGRGYHERAGDERCNIYFVS